MEKATKGKGSDNGLRLIVRTDKKDYHLLAETVEQCDTWIAQLGLARKKASQRPAGSLTTPVPPPGMPPPKQDNTIGVAGDTSGVGGRPPPPSTRHVMAPPNIPPPQ